MYPNLELEMFKRNITSRQLAQACGISECAMRNKRKGRAEFTLPEVEVLLNTFTGCEWRYLFARDAEQAEEKG